ncbi:hypothetical protein CXF68_01950 [Tenacibaculum sp. Bg11-29]|uniref:hypothetical protein n=1 Tax=Tenacibaculum sp. Bg11-29 TaxID=2058306 RepID=UPI000C323628|nr:hypothetical protein [Tenacibaculum sp. Bg11-29]PKH49526.1 hypothetical protein CXF68_01950 [Tenacibaculum sp. Bg11-29]
MKANILTTLLLLLNFIVYSQNHKTIEIDPITDMAKESLPFDQGFVLKKTYSNKIRILGIGYYEIKQSERKEYFSSARTTELNLLFKFEQNKENKYDLHIFVPPLKPQRFYDFLIVHLIKRDDPLITKYLALFKAITENNPTLQTNILDEINKSKKKTLDPLEHIDLDTGINNISELSSFYKSNLEIIYKDKGISEKEKRSLLISKIVDNDLFSRGYWVSSTSEIFSFETRAKFRITPDFGYVSYGFQKDFNGFTPYIGFQIEFRYFDKSIPFKLIPNKTIWHRLSFNTGITLASLKKDEQREDLFDNKSLLMGFGFRLSNALRLTGGVILFNREDPNLLIDNKRLGATPFIGLSIDLSLKQFFNDMSGLIPLNRN